MLITVFAAFWQTWQPALNQSCRLSAPDRGRINSAWVSHSTACVPSLWDHSGASAPAWPGDCCALLVTPFLGFGAPYACLPQSEIFQAETIRETWKISCTLGALDRGTNCRAFFWNNHHLSFHSMVLCIWTAGAYCQKEGISHTQLAHLQHILTLHLSCMLLLH